MTWYNGGWNINLAVRVPEYSGHIGPTLRRHMPWLHAAIYLHGRHYIGLQFRVINSEIKTMVLFEHKIQMHIYVFQNNSTY